ncbi:hypothetical protein ABT382_38175 [Streptomyces pharetrae]|uniref:hypothetical protein n=1 Tax=Streptomyces pharetrae TaxID=291370 RepID=UPI003348DE4E
MASGPGRRTLEQPGAAHAYRWFAGWLATAGEYHLAIRLALAFDILPGHALTRANWPRLHASLDASWRPAPNSWA